MTIDSVQLLARLAGVGGISGVGAVPRTTAVPGGVNFADLLAQASRGEVSSGLAVTVAPASGITLQRPELDRIAAAADLAQSAGAERAAVLLDDKVLELDVAARRVLGEVNLTPGTVLGNIDALVRAPDDGGPPRSQGNAGLDDLQALARAHNPMLQRVLERTPDSTSRSGGSTLSR